MCLRAPCPQGGAGIYLSRGIRAILDEGVIMQYDLDKALALRQSLSRSSIDVFSGRFDVFGPADILVCPEPRGARAAAGPVSS